MARFICASILHLSLVDEINHGLDMMKYACNHRYKFHRFWIAFVCGFLQTIGCMLIEMANIGVLNGANDTIDIVFNFIALAIIAEFDNYVFGSMKNEGLRELISEEFTKKVLIIEHTTSKKCSAEEPSNVKDEEGNYRPLRVSFSSRTFLNMTMYCLYRFLRIFYVSIFFYFMPFSSIILSTLIPLNARGFYHNLPYCPGLY